MEYDCVAMQMAYQFWQALWGVTGIWLFRLTDSWTVCSCTWLLMRLLRSKPSWPECMQCTASLLYCVHHSKSSKKHAMSSSSPTGVSHILLRMFCILFLEFYILFLEICILIFSDFCTLFWEFCTPLMAVSQWKTCCMVCNNTFTAHLTTEVSPFEWQAL